MEINENEIVKYIEPLFYFCVKHLNNRHDAEELASEIMVHILSGIKKYHINSLESWVWRIAYNRYARFIDIRNKHNEIPFENDFLNIQDDYDFIDEMIIDEYQQVFKYLHTLSSQYRNILVDYYIGQLPIKQIAKNYTLPETTVKRRLNISRDKIRTRIGENKMDKVYKRINWNMTSDGQALQPSKYLFSQTSRAICEAVYKKPLTVEEISLKTGLPTMYIEDEIPRLINGDAIVKDGKKYATNFIILHLYDKKAMITKFAPLVEGIADSFSKIFDEHKSDILKMGFYGSDFSIKRLGYIALTAVLREKIWEAKDELNIFDGPHPPHLDGGYGWFLIAETETEAELKDDTATSNYEYKNKDFGIHYFYIGKYFNDDIHGNNGTHWIWKNNIVEKTAEGIIPDGVLTDDKCVNLLKNNLIFKDGDKYKLNFPVFAIKQFEDFKNCFKKLDTKFNAMLLELVSHIHKSFKAFTPRRLDNQISSWVGFYSMNIIGFVAEELIKRGALEKPDNEKPLINGVFCIKGDYCP